MIIYTSINCTILSQNKPCIEFGNPVIGCTTFCDSKTTNIEVPFNSSCKGGDIKIYIEKKDPNGKWQYKKTLTIKGGVGVAKYKLTGVLVNQHHSLRYLAYSGKINPHKVPDSIFRVQNFLAKRNCKC